MKHKELSALVLLNLPSNARLFSNSGGVSQYGKRFIKHGLIKGASDLVGWTVMGKHAIFTAIELKKEKEGARPDQLHFLSRVAEAGGIAAVVRRVSDLDAVFDPERIAKGEVYDER